MTLSPKQKEIVKLFSNDRNKILTQGEISHSVPFGYYANGSKYVGEILSRMVKRNMLVRIKPGHFRLGSFREPVENIDNPNQLELF